MQVFSRDDISAMEQRYRATFINSLSGFRGANLIGTRSKEGIDNLAVFNSVFHVGANPPLLGMVFRPHTVRRDTLENILDTGAYTINHIHSEIIAQAHQTSAKYEKHVSEFEAVGLTPQLTNEMDAPYVAESRLKIGLASREIIPITSNDTIIVVGEVQQVILEEGALEDDGLINLEQLYSTSIVGLDSYYLPQKLARFNYAEPDKATTKK